MLHDQKHRDKIVISNVRTNSHILTNKIIEELMYQINIPTLPTQYFLSSNMSGPNIELYNTNGSE